MNYSLNNTFVLTALDMGKERGAKQLVVCQKIDGEVEIKGDWDKREKKDFFGSNACFFKCLPWPVCSYLGAV